MITNNWQIGLQTENRGVVNPTLNPQVTPVSAFLNIFFKRDLLINIRSCNSLNSEILGGNNMDQKFINFYGIVYITYNLCNGKFYIGKTILDNSNYLGSGKILNYAIKKYGKVNFKRKILCVCYSKKELNFAEEYLIKKYQACKFGYNIAKGGNGGDTWTNSSDESKKQRSEKIGIGNKGKYVSEKTGKLIRLSKIGKPSKIKGVPFTEGHCRNISIGRKGIVLPKGHCKNMGRFGENNGMFGKSLYSVWLEKFGKDEADKREENRKSKEKNKKENKTEQEKKEHGRKISIAISGENNPMFGKSFYSVWLEKFGKEIADQKYIQWKENLKKRNN